MHLEVNMFKKNYLHLTFVKVLVFEAKSKNQFEGENLHFEKLFQMPMLMQGEKQIVAKETLWSEAKENVATANTK